MCQAGARAVKYAAQLLGRIITLFITSVKEVMCPDGITGGDENQRLVFLRCNLWPLQIYVYAFVPTYPYVCKYHVYVTDIGRITHIWVLSCVFWTCRLWVVRACILLFCLASNSLLLSSLGIKPVTVTFAEGGLNFTLEHSDVLARCIFSRRATAIVIATSEQSNLWVIFKKMGSGSKLTPLFCS